MSKSKIWKAERQEDLAFHGESERMKLLLSHTLTKIRALVWFIHVATENTLNPETLNNLPPKEITAIRAISNLCSDCSDEAGMLQMSNFGNRCKNYIEVLSRGTLNNIKERYLENIPETSDQLIQTFQGLLDCFELRFNMNASSCKDHKKRLRRAWQEQRRYKEETRGLRNELYALQMAMKTRVAAKTRRIKHQENEIIELKKSCTEEIAKLCAENEESMEQACVASQDHQEELERELSGGQSTLTELQIAHRISESNLKADKKQAEATLETVIAQYDEIMFKLHAEMNGTRDGYLNELQQLEALKVKFERQEQLYTAAMREKAREEQEELDRRVLLFRQRMAAGRIQACWRAYLQRKLDRSRGKKGKKGRKKQANEKKK